MRHVSAIVLLGFATVALAKLDSKCQATCGAQGYAADFCARMCTYDPEKGSITGFGVTVSADPPPEPPTPPAAPRWQPPLATLVRVNPVEDELRNEVSKLKAENAALKRELAVLRRASR